MGEKKAFLHKLLSTSN